LALVEIVVRSVTNARLLPADQAERPVRIAELRCEVAEQIALNPRQTPRVSQRLN